MAEEQDGMAAFQQMMAQFVANQQRQQQQQDPQAKLKEEYDKIAVPLGGQMVSAREEVGRALCKLTKQSSPALAEEMLKVMSPPSGVCAKEITDNDICWTCNTCAQVRPGIGGQTLLCMACVQQGEHEGHDLFMRRNASGTCDCGEPDFIKPEGFCRLHAGKGLDDLDYSQLDPALAKPLSELIVAATTGLERASLDFDHPTFSPKQSDKAKKLYKPFLFYALLLDKLSALNTYAAKRVAEEIMQPSRVTNFKHSTNSYGSDGKCRPWTHSAAQAEPDPKECQCSRLDNIMRCFYRLQEEARVACMRIGYNLLQSLKFKVFFTLCYAANYMQAVLAPRFENQGTDIYEDLAAHTLALQRVSKQMLLKKEAISNIMITLHEGLQRRVTKQDRSINLKTLLTHWSMHFSNMTRDIRNLAIIHNASIIPEMLLQEMTVIDFFFQVERPEQQLPPFIVVHHVDNSLLAIFEKLEIAALPVALSFATLKNFQQGGLEKFSNLVMGVLKQTNQILQSLNQKNLFAYIYLTPKYIAYVLLRLVLIYFEKGDYDKRLEMKSKLQPVAAGALPELQKTLSQKEADPDFSASAAASQSELKEVLNRPDHPEPGEEAKLDKSEIAKIGELKSEENKGEEEGHKEGEKEGSEKKKAEEKPQQEGQEKEKKDEEEEKMPNLVEFARRAVLRVMGIKDSSQFQLLVTLLIRCGFGLSNLFFDVQVGWWNRLGIEVIQLQNYYYGNIVLGGIPRHFGDYGLIQLGLLLGWTNAAKQHYEGRIQGYIEKINQLKLLAHAGQENCLRVAEVVQKEMGLVLHQFVNVIVCPKPMGAIVAKLIDLQDSVGIDMKNLPKYDAYVRALIRAEIFHALAQLDEPKKGAQYEIVMRVTDDVFNRLPQFEEEFRKITTRCDAGRSDAAGLNYRLALEKPEIQYEFEMTLDPYYYEKVHLKAKIWEHFPDQPLGVLVKKMPEVGLRMIPLGQELREVAVAFDAEFLTTHLVLEDVKAHLTEEHKVDILKLFALGLEFREYDNEGKKFSEVENQLIRDILVNIRTAECEGEANRILKAAINQLLRFLEMQGELTNIEAAEKLQLAGQDDEKEKLRLKKEKAKQRALKKFKKQQKQFSEKNKEAKEVAKEEEEQKESESCCLCHERLDKQHREHPWGRACYIGKHRLLYHGFKTAITAARMRNSALADLPQEIRNPDELLPVARKFLGGGLFTKSCGHYLHYKCLNEMKTDAQLEQKFQLDIGTNPRQFVCPLCKAIGNTLVPVLSNTEVSEAPLQQIPEFKYSSYNTDNILDLACSDFMTHFVESNRELGQNKMVDPRASVTCLVSDIKDNPLFLFQTLVNFISYEIQSVPLRGKSGFHAYLKYQIDRKPIFPQIYYALRTMSKSLDLKWTSLATSFTLKAGKLLKAQMMVGEVDLFEIIISKMLLQEELAYTADLKELVREIVLIQASLAEESACHFKRSFDFPSDPSSLFFSAQCALLVLTMYKQRLMGDVLKEFQEWNGDQLLGLLWERVLQIEDTPAFVAESVSTAVSQANGAFRGSHLTKYPWIEYISILPDFQLYQIPKAFTEFQLDTYGKPCKKCGTNPKNMGRCLLCGARICLFSGCCEVMMGTRRIGEGTMHTLQCGAGMGAIATAFETGVILIDGGRCNDKGGFHVGEMGEVHAGVSSHLVKWDKKFADLRMRLLDYQTPTSIARERVDKEKSFKLFVV